MGVLPGNLIQSVQNLVAYKLGTADKSAGDRAISEELNNAILSVGSSLSGSTCVMPAWTALTMTASLSSSSSSNAPRSC